MAVTKTVAAVLGAIVVIVALVVGCYLGGWWLFEDSNKRESEIRRTSVNYQETLIEQSTHKVSEIRTIDVQITNATPEQATPLRAQRRAIVTETCELIGQVNGTIPPNLATFQTQECS